MKEQKAVLLKNAFLGKVSKKDLQQVDGFIEKAKVGLEETQAALKERQKEIQAKNRVVLEEKMKIHLNHKKNQRARKDPSEKSKKKKKNKKGPTSNTETPSTSQQN